MSCSPPLYFAPSPCPPPRFSGILIRGFSLHLKGVSELCASLLRKRTATGGNGEDENEREDDLPTEEERARLGEIVSSALIELRILGWKGKAAQAADLAEAFHNLPREMYGYGRFNWQITRGMLQWYEEKWPDQHHRYTAMLDKIHPAA